MQFSDLQNSVLQRLHQAGANWGGSASNTSSNLIPPYWVKLELNLAYGRFLALVKDFPAVVQPLKVQFPSMSQQKQWPINPLPSSGTGVAPSLGNPAALQIYEATYTISTGQERYIPFVSTNTFRRYTAGYTQRQASFSAFPNVLCQQFGRGFIQLFPGTGTNGDTVTVTFCPDPNATATAWPGNQIPCAQGGQMVNDSDVPLIVPEYHPALIEGAVWSMARALNKPQIAADAKALWDQLVQEAIDFGSTVAEGDAEQQVIDTWVTQFDSQANIMGGG